MSNPAVIELSNTRLSNNTFVRIEDNIGESIHIHVQNYRFDFSVNDFLDFSNLVEKALNDLLHESGFLSHEFDPLFLEDMSSELCDLKEVTLDYVLMSSLFVSRSSWWKVTLIPILSSTYLSKEYTQSKKNQRGQGVLSSLASTVQRLTGIKKSVLEHGYPFKDQHIVLFNDEFVIRDGQHRAICLSTLGNDEEYILVKRLWFENCRHGNQSLLKRLVVLSSFVTLLKRVHRKSISIFRILSIRWAKY
jgi:hypothetical protein